MRWRNEMYHLSCSSNPRSAWTIVWFECCCFATVWAILRSCSSSVSCCFSNEISSLFVLFHEDIRHEGDYGHLYEASTGWCYLKVFVSNRFASSILYHIIDKAVCLLRSQQSLWTLPTSIRQPEVGKKWHYVLCFAISLSLHASRYVEMHTREESRRDSNCFVYQQWRF